MSTAHHIRQHSLQVQHRGACDGLALRRDLARWQEEIWLPLLENTLARFDLKGQVIRIPKLAVDICTYGKDWRRTIATITIQELEQALKKALVDSQPNAMGPISAQKQQVELLRYFLRNGRLPWWSDIKDKQTWDAWLETFFNTVSVEDAIAIVSEMKIAEVRRRFLRETGGCHFWKLAATIFGTETAQMWQEDEQAMQRFQVPTHVMHHYIDCLLQAFASTREVRDLNEQFCHLFAKAAGTKISKHIHAALKNPALAKRLGDDNLSEDGDEFYGPAPIQPLDAGDEFLYLGNAGLVLLAAFLPAFFRRLHLLEEETRIGNIPEAVLLLHYLTTGRTNAAEWELVMPKLLCGCLPEDLISVHDLLLSSEALSEADSLLEAVIAHWTALKNTTPAGLRYNFLQREGRLHFQHMQWHLKVQREAHDLLLDFLPWNAGMIKLPWMNHLLLVKWNE